jgi:hypothetical protein
MTDILYERTLSAGPVVRVRRLSAEGSVPVRAVLELDRRGGQLRPGQQPGNPPPLLEIEGPTDSEVLSQLLEHALEDADLAKLMRDHGLR